MSAHSFVASVRLDSRGRRARQLQQVEMLSQTVLLLGDALEMKEREFLGFEKELPESSQDLPMANYPLLQNLLQS